MKNPIKFSLKKELCSLIIIFLVFGAGFYFYNHFPDRVASHWNFSGQVDGYSNRFGGAFALPIMLLAIYIMFTFLPLLDPNKDKYKEFEKVYVIFKAMFVIFFALIFLASGFFNLGYPIKINLIVPWLIGVMFIIIGNYMGKIKRNWFVGIKTPWTLSSDRVWNKTHRFGGYMFIVFGVLMIISPLLNQFWGILSFTVGLLISVVGTFLYSYIEYKKENKEK